MAALKTKVTVRLERTNGEVRTFWEITRVKATLSTRFGRRLSAGRKGPEKTFESAAAAEKAMVKAIEDKRREGYDEPGSKLAPRRGRGSSPETPSSRRSSTRVHTTPSDTSSTPIGSSSRAILAAS